MTVDISKIRPGDTVTVRGEVVSVWRSGPNVKVGGAEVCLAASDIISHTPAPREWKVGDRVMTKQSLLVFTIKGIDGEWAWLGGESWPVRLNNLVESP